MSDSQPEHRAGSSPVGLGGAVAIVFAVVVISGAYMAWDSHQRQIEEQAQLEIERAEQQAEREMRERAAAEEMRLTLLRAESKRPTKTLLETYSIGQPLGSRRAPYAPEHSYQDDRGVNWIKLIVTDVGVDKLNVEFVSNGVRTPSQMGRVLFEDMNCLKTEERGPGTIADSINRIWYTGVERFEIWLVCDGSYPRQAVTFDTRSKRDEVFNVISQAQDAWLSRYGEIGAPDYGAEYGH